MKILIIVLIISAVVYLSCHMVIQWWVVKNQSLIREKQMLNFLKYGQEKNGEPLTHPVKFAPVILRRLLFLSIVGLFVSFWGLLILGIYHVLT